MIQETWTYIYKIRINVIHTCRNYNIHIYMILICRVLTYLLICGKLHFPSFVYESLEPTFFFSFELVVSFSFESFIPILDNQLQIKCLHRPFCNVLMRKFERLASPLASCFTFWLMRMLTALASASASYM